MATIVVATNGRTSLLNAYRELARRLRAADHRVVFVTGADVAERLAAEGEPVVALTHDRRFGAAVDADPPPPPTAPLALVPWLRRRRELHRRSITGEEIAEAVAGAAPDLVLLDAEFQVGILATSQLAVPRALMSTFFSIFAGPDLPPISSLLGPPEGPLDRLRVRAAWWRLRADARWVGLRRRLSRKGLAALLRPMPLDTNDLGLLRVLARRCEVDLRRVGDRGQWLRPYLIRDLPVLTGNPSELDLPHRQHPRLAYLGPLIRLDRTEPALDGDDRTRWTALVEARRAAGHDRRPLVYATLGTIALDDRDLLDRIVAAFAARPDRDLVLGLGGVVDPADLAPLPDNVLALRWAPQLEILAEADVVVTHGGSGSLREAVHFGVPSVVYPTGHEANDQAGTASRVAHHRLGVVGDADGDGPEAIEAAVTTALTDPGIAAAVASMREVFRTADREGRAVAVIEDLLDGAERRHTIGG